MRKYSVRMLLCAGICMAAVAGTSQVSYASTETAAVETQMEDRKAPQNDGSVMAKITSISGDTIAVVMAEQPGELGEKMAPPEKPENGMTPREKPETKPESKPEINPETELGSTADKLPEKKEMEFTSESSTLILTSSTIITKGMSQETGLYLEGSC